ncbi:MAG: hypothetical protein A3J07_03275 [Candidatus Doudnabacteria bacterium RIFCSPLOWO2_02_FULL_49_13]|nr:MAG: hypothetical protein A3B77_02080 [Candidatus Doudnabacteria bacterium RIFCSPHIGHO2_02_FULL_49_24]OGE89366.1 MAG: hypothetical protein A2760_03270 [Candidatus Doudnabacteria bacterium RIFCSPHIGHO2_01_FULL_50_67]OGE97512.1 MAG: hypothetical protein A2990_02215 [Candidatus Doudnabacteria bacterium RIFCSPLOWO2_01_FULL_49_40]OGF03084.1 MAG: hypothetical protein A3J07_03275 [Candidatus Doudnabacteria bacterium RIFCSPLOWO2_02_FULL_49_13]OGF03588.1 MAG: hypothetical protein A3H14_01030 [Candida
MAYFWTSLISGLLILIGVLGSILPILPGLPVAFLGFLIFSWFTNFALITPMALAVFALLIVLTIAVDTLAPALAARQHKASSFGIAGAVIGAFAGIFILGPVGILLGPFAGAYLGELIAGGNQAHALKSAYGALIGLVVGSAFKLIVGISMFVYFMVRVL